MSEHQVKRLIAETNWGVNRGIIGVWDVRSLSDDKLAQLRDWHESEFVYAEEYDRLAQRIADLEAENATLKAAGPAFVSELTHADIEKAVGVPVHAKGLTWGAAVSLLCGELTEAREALARLRAAPEVTVEQMEKAICEHWRMSSGTATTRKEAEALVAGLRHAEKP